MTILVVKRGAIDKSIEGGGVEDVDALETKYKKEKGIIYLQLRCVFVLCGRNCI